MNFGSRSGRRLRALARACAGAAPLFAVLLMLPMRTLADGGSPAPTASPEPAGLSMDARALLQGHARAGSWMAISVSLANDGPPITGELRMLGGTQNTTRFSVPVDLPTTSRKAYAMYVQAPVFGSKVDVALVSNDRVLATRQVAFAIHDFSQLTVGVIADRPGDLIASLGGLNDPTAPRPAVFAIAPSDLPARPEAWAALDRLVWQDVDSTELTPEQLAALRTWIAGGGRLTLVGGTNGTSVLGAFPDELLPYRPATTLDADPTTIRALVGGSLPAGATPVAAIAGTLRDGQALATSGDRAIAATLTYGSGAVAILGFDPASGWLKGTDRATAAWQRVIPARSSAAGQPLVGDDSMFTNQLGNIPTLALPAIEGLLLLLLGYILLVGPVNYLVLRRLDKREWAWLSIPLIVGGFAVAAFAIGNTLRGSDVIVNQIAIVRGAPGTDAAQAQVFLGVFSPSRRSYSVTVGNGALLTAPLSDPSGTGVNASLDVVQADPATARDLSVGYGSMRTMRADAPVAAPRLAVSLSQKDGRLTGTVRNDSAVRLVKPAIVIGFATVQLGDLAPGQTATVDTTLVRATNGMQLSDRVFGPSTGFDPSTPNGMNDMVRRQLVDALTYDQLTGSSGTLPTDGPVLLAWGAPGLLDVKVDGLAPVMTGQTLYYEPLDFGMTGKVVFTPDLIRVSVAQNSGALMQKDAWNVALNPGTVTLAYRPRLLQGTLTNPSLTIATNFGDPSSLPAPSGSITALPPASASPSANPSGSPTPNPSASPTVTSTPSATPVPTPSLSPQLGPSSSPIPPGASGASPTPSPTAVDLPLPVATAPPTPTTAPTVGPIAPPGPVAVPGFGNGRPGFELFDLVAGAWRALPDFPSGSSVTINEAERFVDAQSGTVLLRLTNSSATDTIGIALALQISGDVR